MTNHLGRLVLAALGGALVLFVWGAVSHTSLIKGVGFTPLPNEDEVLAVLRASLPDDGLYFYPGIDFDAATAEEEARVAARYVEGPTGLIVHRRGGEPALSASKLLVQFVGDLLAAVGAAWLVAQIGGGYRRRVGVVAGLAVFGWLATSSLFWNWYGFTDAFFLAHGFDKVVGWLLAGGVIARVVPARVGDVG